MSKYKIVETPRRKIISGPDFHHTFNYESGKAATWGHLPEDDPQVPPVGPLLLDVEISTVCNRNCNFCYKSNGPVGENMGAEKFKTLLDKFIHPNGTSIGQIAFGIGSLDGNPDLLKILWHAREQRIIPNITLNGDDLTQRWARNLAEVLGAAAVSNYDRNTCYNSVALLLDHGLKQVNIHQLLCEETLGHCWQVLRDIKTDPRLVGLGAVVFLLLKPKGERNSWHPLRNSAKYKELIDFALDNNLPVGFDSCGANAFTKAIENRREAERLMTLVEPCESGLFSLYVDKDGTALPCSFCGDLEDVPSWNLLEVNNFMDDCWNSYEMKGWRERLLANGRACPIYPLGME